MHEQVFAGRDALLNVGEMPGVTVDEAILFTDPARAEVDMVFQFDHVWADRGPDPWQLIPLRLTTLKGIFGRWQAGLAEVGWNSLYWNNHDQPRVVSRYGDDGKYRVESAKMLGTVLHLHRGTPYVYQGEELGMTNAPFGTIADFRDIEAIGQYADAVTMEGRSPEDVLTVLRARGRDNARTPMQWDASPQAGFTTGTPWLAVNPNHTEINAAAAIADPDSVYHYYRRLIDLRHTEPAVVEGDFTMLLPHDERLYAYTRRLGDDGVAGDRQLLRRLGAGGDRRRRGVGVSRVAADQHRDAAVCGSGTRPVAGRGLSPFGQPVMVFIERN